MIHKLDPQLLEHPIRILVVGCGGNGSAVLSGLPYLHQALLAFDHPGGLAVTAVDPDIVSETNCVRQPFCRTEIGLPKATVLVHRINSFWGLNWQGMQAEIQQISKGSEVDVVVGCVDTRKARRSIDAWVRKTRVLYWLDLGNGASTGQFVLGQPNNAVNRKKKSRLRTVAELYPEILAPDDKHGQQPACSAVEALTRQEPFINQNLAYQALAMLTQLLRRGSLSFHGGFCNLATGQLVPLLDHGTSRHATRAQGLDVAVTPMSNPLVGITSQAPTNRLPPIWLIPPEPVLELCRWNSAETNTARSTVRASAAAASNGEKNRPGALVCSALKIHTTPEDFASCAHQPKCAS